MLASILILPALRSLIEARFAGVVAGFDAAAGFDCSTAIVLPLTLVA
jgi:hypothetical protein